MVKIKNKAIFLIIAVGLFLRLYHLPSSINFSWDQERDAYTIKQLLIEKKPTLIGPRVVNDQGFMLGPYFFYLLAPFYLITNLHPYATIIFVCFYNLLFLTLSYLILKKLFSIKIAHIFTSIWSISPLAISIDTISWNPLLVPLLFICLLFFLKKLDFNKPINWFILGLYLGFSFNIHVQLLILSLLTIIYFLLTKSKNIFRYSPLLCLGFLTSFLPLLIFDLRHQFLNFHLFINFFNHPSSIKNFFAFIPVWSNYTQAIFYLKSTFFSIIFWCIIGLVLFLNRQNKIYFALFFTWILFPLIFIFYGKRPSEYYFNFCLPIIILVFSQLISKSFINSKIITLIIISLSFLAITNKIKTSTLQSFSLANKIQVIKYIKTTIGNQKFNISYSVPIGQNSGYSYLLDYYQLKPTNNPSDPLIQIIIPAKTNLPSFGDISIQIPPSFSQ